MSHTAPEPYRPKRKFVVITHNGQHQVVADSVWVSEGFVIFGDGPENAEKTNVRIYSASNIQWIQEQMDE